MQYDRSVRLLHLGIVISILFQLATDQFVGLPEPGHFHRHFDALLVGIHESVGVISLLLVSTYLLIKLDAEPGRQQLFPWLFPDTRTTLWQELWRDFPCWLSGSKPLPASTGCLAGTVHGAGIMLALLLDLSGALLFIDSGPGGSMPPDTRIILKAHGFMADVMWIFVLGHAGMALLHEIRGHRIVRAMFRLGRATDG